MIVKDAAAFFRDVIEPLCDPFEPSYCDEYARLFSRVIEMVRPELRAEDLLARYQRVRCPTPVEGEVTDVYVLSRVTLGADVAVTSIILDGAKKRFPDARIHFVGSPKACELFSGDTRVRPQPLTYGRSAGLADRIDAGLALREIVDHPGGIVLDPDSRLTQLGLVPVCAEENYYFFESRAWGGEGTETIGQLTARWVEHVVGVPNAGPYIAPGVAPASERDGLVTVSLGVGENRYKRVEDPYEEMLLNALVELGLELLVDYGAGEDEQRRVEYAISKARGRPGQIQTWNGTFAPFAASIARSRLYLGYDSAGQHVAATCGVPLVTVFTGYAAPRTFHRWRPDGTGPIEVLPVERPEPEAALRWTMQAVDRLLC